MERVDRMDIRGKQILRDCTLGHPAWITIANIRRSQRASAVIVQDADPTAYAALLQTTAELLSEFKQAATQTLTGLADQFGLTPTPAKPNQD
ncbi:MAG: hypothetical protein ABI791_04570 [Acidobacteriota bacterium]